MVHDYSVHQKSVVDHVGFVYLALQCTVVGMVPVKVHYSEDKTRGGEGDTDAMIVVTCCTAINNYDTAWYVVT